MKLAASYGYMLWINTNFLRKNTIYRYNLIASSCRLAEAESTLRKTWTKIPTFQNPGSVSSFLCWLPTVDFLRSHFGGFLNLDDRMSHTFPSKEHEPRSHSMVFRTSSECNQLWVSQKFQRLAGANKEYFSFPVIEAISFRESRGFPGGSDSKKSACNARDLGLIPGSGRSSREGIPWTEEPGGLQS